ncbi:MAG: PAS domain S-box protein, partial [Halobacteriota archaeon]|nr:PAS domain S-box protein [Halobacteriota archaeon]
ALQESEERYKTLVRTSPEAITVSDLKGVITEVSEQTLELHGFGSPEELIGRNAFDLIASEDHERAMENLNKTLEGESVRNIEYTLLRGDGSSFIGELNAALVKDAYGRPKEFIATTRDITERKRVEEALKSSEEKYRQLFKSSPELLSLVDREGRFLSVNPAMAESFGLSVEELTGKRVFEVAPEEVARRRTEMVNRALDDGQPLIFEDERDGSYFHIIVVPVKIPGHKETVQVIARDITEKKKAEMDIKRSKEELERAYEELKKLDRMKTEFAAVATHEIGTPLSILKTNVEMLEGGVFGCVTDAQKERLWTISRNIDYLVKLNREMMDISRIDAERLKLEIGPHSINDLIIETVQDFGILARDKRLNLTVDLPEDEFIVNCDGERIKQVLDNLLINAIKFTPATGEINIRVEDLKDKILIAVSDNGVGIPEEEHKKIFQRFYEVGDYLSHETGGFGLGLAIVKGIIEAHGCDVWVKSIAGKGSTFYFTLPKERGT